MCNSHPYLQFVVVSTIMFAANPTTANARTIVLPPGFVDTQGDTVFNPTDTFPFGGTVLDNGGRVQELYLASEFLSFGSGPLVISRLALRPDESVNAAIDTDWEITALNLSTTATEPGSLNSTFSENYGDDVTTVFTGNVNLQTDGVRLGNAPHDFDYVVDFETEFVYDPAEGNLLVEFIFVAGGKTWQDAHDLGDGLDRLILALGPNQTVATTMIDAVTVYQFTIIPEPSSAALLGLGLIGLLAQTRSGRRRV